MQSGSPSHMSCVLRLHTETPGWHKSMMQVLKNIQDVSYSIDAQQGLAYVSGKIEPDTILKMLAKAGKHAEVCRVDYGYNQHQTMENNLVQVDYRYNQNQRMENNLDDPQQRSWSQNPPHYTYYKPLPKHLPQPLPLPPVEKLKTVEPQCCYVM